MTIQETPHTFSVKTLSLFGILSQMELAHAISSYFFSNNFNIIIT